MFNLRTNPHLRRRTNSQHRPHEPHCAPNHPVRKAQPLPQIDDVVFKHDDDGLVDKVQKGAVVVETVGEQHSRDAVRSTGDAESDEELQILGREGAAG
jgi:hypothetical protein